MTAWSFVRFAVKQKTVMLAYPFLVRFTDFPGQNSRYGQQNSLCKLLEAISFWHTILLGIRDCHFLPSARAEVSYAAIDLSNHNQFSQQKICPKAQKLHLAEQLLPHNSLQPLFNIRQKLGQLDCWQLTMSVLHCDFHCFRLSCLSKIAGLRLIEDARAHDV